MNALPYFLFVALVAMFIYDYIPNKALLAVACLIAFTVIFAYWFYAQEWFWL